MKAPDESGINKDFTEKSTDWIATAGKRCTGVIKHPIIGASFAENQHTRWPKLFTP